MKVYELSKDLGLENKQLIEIAQGLNIDVKSHLSVLDEESIQKIKVTVNTISKDELQFKEEIKQTKPKVEEKQWKPDLNRMICLKNLARGRLTYKSKRQMGYTLQWEKTGDKNYIELGEFLNLKNTDMRFITEPWVREIEDDELEILKYANILQYYNGILGFNNVEDILTLDFDTFKKKFDKLPEGYKKTVAEHAVKMIKTGELDSIKIKRYIEEQLEIDLDFLARE